MVYLTSLIHIFYGVWTLSSFFVTGFFTLYKGRDFITFKPTKGLEFSLLGYVNRIFRLNGVWRKTEKIPWPIRTKVKYHKKPVRALGRNKRGKGEWPNRNWFSCCTWLVELEGGASFLNQSKSKRNWQSGSGLKQNHFISGLLSTLDW